MPNSAHRPRPLGNPARGGTSLSAKPWPRGLDVPPYLEPGEVVGQEFTQFVKGYTTKAGRVVEPYARKRLIYYEVPFQAKKAPPPPGPIKFIRWLPVETYLTEKYKEWGEFEVQDPIYRKKEGHDLIDPNTLFIWHEPVRSYDMKTLGAREVALVRVWILLYNSNNDEYFVFCRTRSLLLTPEWTRQSIQEAYKAHVSEGYFDEQLGRAYPSIYQEVREWAEEHTDYVEVREILAWTVFNVPRGTYDPEKAPAKTYATGRAEHPHKKRRRSKPKIRLFT